MSLRNPEIKASNKSVAKVENSYYKLMKLMLSNMAFLQTISTVAINKREFDARRSDWFTRTGIMSSSKDTIRFNAAPTCSAKYNPQH